ncbi:MAG: hypothetical protein KDA73_04200 [Rhodobacteraceae bacterium]|nr:hypothetical protein [Paracoccaceae bacterium]
MIRSALVAVWLAVLALPGASGAGPFTAFETDLLDAYAAYRTALFQSNMGNAAATSQALDLFAGRWGAISATWGMTPPPQYADDPAFGQTLKEVGDTITRATKDVKADNLPAVHATLEKVRDEIGALHERNGLIGFSDRMNAYHTEMERVIGLDLRNPDAQQLQSLSDGAAVLAYLAAEIAANPAPGSADPAYQGLVEGLTTSVATLQAAVRTGDAAACRAAVAKLKPAYSKLFLRFG